MKNFMIIFLMSLLGFFGCSHGKHHGHGEHGSKEHVCTCGKDKDGSMAAKIVSKSGSKVTGSVKAIPGHHVKLEYKFEGLRANGTHGFHIHEVADCSAKDASSAGGHWNPKGHKHGAMSDTSHAGDLGNIKADSKGVSQGTLDLQNVKLADIKDKAFVVHEKADDLKSDPAGNSGPRIGCGVF
jgi:Cu-Zn family superoxide dismutase